MATKVSFEEAKQLLDTVQNILLFDVRNEEEYITGHMIDAELFSIPEITEESAAQRISSKDTPVMVYCKSGMRSAKAAAKLDSYGYKAVYDVGSLVGWPYGLEQ